MNYMVIREEAGKMMQGKKTYIEAIRIFAILGVIFNHTDGFAYYMSTENVVTWVYSMTLAIVSRTAVPLFFMIMGALLLEKSESLKEIYLKRIIRFGGILLVVSLLYYEFDIIRGKVENATITDFLEKLCTNNIRESFWFLYEYIFLLIVFPLIAPIVHKLNTTLVIYLMILRGMVDFLLPLLSQIANFSIKFDIVFGKGYIYYVILGYFFCHEGEELYKKIKQKMLWIILGGVICFAAIINYILNLKTGNYLSQALDYMMFIETPIIWVVIRKLIEKVPKESKWNGYIIIGGGCTFGVYLFDNFVRWQLLPIYLFLTEKSVGILACSVYVILTFMIGLFYTWLIKKIHIIGNFI